MEPLILTRQKQIHSLLKLGWRHLLIGRELGGNRKTVGRCSREILGDPVLSPP